MNNLPNKMEDKKPFFISTFRRSTISEIRSIIRKNNRVSLWYDTKANKELKLVFDIIKNSRSEYVLQIHIPLQDIQELQLLNSWRYQNEFQIENEEMVYTKKDSLSEILNIINFMKHFKVETKIIDTQLINFKDLIGHSNVDNLPFNKLFVNDNEFGYNNPSKIRKWSEEKILNVFKHALNYLEIPYSIRNDIIAWWYNGYKFKTKINTVPQIGYGICYRPNTLVPKEFKSVIKSVRSNGWIFNQFLNIILLTNLIDKTNSIGYKNIIFNRDYNQGKLINNYLIDDKIMHPGDPSYIIDSVFDDCPDDKPYWTSKKDYWLSSEKIKPEIIEKEALKKLLELDPNIIEKLSNLKYKNIIIGYYEYREIYCHPNPYKQSSFHGWRYNNPIVLNVETNLVEYYVLNNNEKFPYPEAKILNNKMLVQFAPNMLSNWWHEIPLENGIN